jgi:hypothetical protein
MADKYKGRHAKPDKKADKEAGKHGKPAGRGKPDVRPGVRVQPEPSPPSCGMCRWVLNTNDGRWARLSDPNCPQHSKGPLSNG